MLSGMLATALFISLELGNAHVDQHPVELIAIMTWTFWFLAVMTAAILAMSLLTAERRRTGS